MKQAITRRIGVALGAAAIAASAMSLAACSKTEEKPASPSPTVSSTEKNVNDGWDGRPNNGGRPDFNDDGSKPNKSVPDVRGPVGLPTGQVGNN